jgi:hypothetical protein
MSIFTYLIQKRGWIIITCIVVLTIILGVYIKNVGVESDILTILPPDDPVVIQYKEIGEKFGGNTIGMVIIQCDSVFRYPVLSKVKELEEQYKEIEGVGFTQSIISMIDIKRTEEGIEISELIGDDIPVKKARLDSIKNYVLSKEMYRNVILSEDGRYTAIITRFMEGYDRNEIGMKIRNITEKRIGDLKVYYSGLPLLMTFVNEMIRDDLKKLLPITVLLVIFVLGFGFRKFSGVFLPLLSVLIATIWMVGSMGIFHKDFTLISNLMPVILIAVGSAYGIHVLNRFYEDNDIKSTIKHVALPIILAALTTITGFLSFLTSGLVPIKEFGIFSAIGVLASLIISLTFIPSIIFLIYKKSKTSKKKFQRSKKIVRALSKVTILFKDYFIVIAAALFVITLIFSPTIRRAADILEYFKEGSPIKEALDISTKNFGGSRPIMLDIKGDFNDPSVLNTIGYIERYLRKNKFVKSSQSIVNLLKEINYNLTGFYIIPDDEAKVSNLYFFLLGQEMTEMLVDDDKSEGLVQASLATEDMGEIREIVEETEDFLSSLTVKEDWHRDILLWDLSKAGVETDGFPEIVIPEVPDEIIEESLIDYLNGEEVPVILSEFKKNEVIKSTLNKNYEKIERIGGEDGAYLTRDIKTIVLEVTTKYKINNIYDQIIKVELDNDLRKQIEGDIYWLLKDKVPTLSPHKFEIIHTGFPRIHVRLDRKLFLSQFQSMGMAVLLVFFMLLILLRSPQGALFSLIPIIFTVTINFGIMELLRIPLDEATVMIAALAIGIGIDYVIHFTNRLKEELENKGNLELAIKESIETTGLAILINAISVAVGFLALFGAQLVPLQRFGILVTGTMLVSSLSSITTLPALLLRFKPKYIMQIINNNKKE